MHRHGGEEVGEGHATRGMLRWDRRRGAVGQDGGAVDQDGGAVGQDGGAVGQDGGATSQSCAGVMSR